ncbi:MAG: helix-turn-helix domain-containing protein, partial [Mycobacterium sp.]
MRNPVPALRVTAMQRRQLKSLAGSQTVPHREVVRARALLMAADGRANTAIAAELSVAPGSVANWRARFAEDGTTRFGQVRKGRGRKPTIPQSKVNEIVELTKNSTPDAETHWSCRTMAKKVGVSKDTVQRV